MDEWLQGDFALTALALVTEKGSACSSYFNLGTVRRLVQDHAARKENYQRHIFALLSFELWHRRFLEGRTVTIQ
jgi:asparagine synthase (glutamine-hydrolysing)